MGAYYYKNKDTILENAKEYYTENKDHIKELRENRFGIATCLKCGIEIKRHTINQLFCTKCGKNLVLNATSEFPDSSYGNKGHFYRFKIKMLFPNLPEWWTIHHIDENHSNDNYGNLLVLPKHLHIQLHNMLRYEKFLTDFAGKEWINYSLYITEQFRKEHREFIMLTGAEIINILTNEKYQKIGITPNYLMFLMNEGYDKLPKF